MRKVEIQADLSIPRKLFWKRVLEVKSYPEYFKYIYDVHPPDEIKVGSTWEDMTTILWLPIRIKHEVVRIEKEREIAFKFQTFSGGEVVERLKIEGSGQMTRIRAEIEINFRSKLVDFFIGPVLAYRFKNMVKSAIKNFEKKHL